MTTSDMMLVYYWLLLLLGAAAPLLLELHNKNLKWKIENENPIVIFVAFYWIEERIRERALLSSLRFPVLIQLRYLIDVPAQ